MVNKRVSRISSRLTAVLSALFVVASIAAPVNASTQTDIVGPPGSGQFGSRVTALPNGNFVVSDPYYDAGTTIDVGAVHLYDGATLARISTLTGSNTGDQVGTRGILVLSNGNFVVSSPYWDNGAMANAGAVTWCSGTSGCSGPVTTANSLVGTQEGDGVGDVTVLPNGSYIVQSKYWDNGSSIDAGAVTWCSGISGCSGPVTETNSLVGSHTGDKIGDLVDGDLVVLSNGNYVVGSPVWDNGTATDAGAVTWCSETSGCSGPVTAANSLVGTQATDQVGSGDYLYGDVFELINGNYVVNSPNWRNGTVSHAGAVTWCSGITGCTGPVTADNSMVGTQAGDLVGIYPIAALTNGNYVVIARDWNYDTVSNAGAVRWCNGMGGCTGPLTETNSLVGTHVEDRVGQVWVLPNGNYVVRSSFWDNGAVPNVGATTWCSGTEGCSGPVTETNSLVGSHTGDDSSDGGPYPLSNGNYVVLLPYWDNGTVTDAGSATWCSGTAGCTGPITEAKSLVGTQTNEHLGLQMIKLTNGNYVLSSGSIWCDGTSGCTGLSTSVNRSMTVGNVYALSNGNYVVASNNKNNGPVTGAGAVTWCSGTSGCSEQVTPANSLVGTQAGDGVGDVTVLPNGDYIVQSKYWDNGPIIDAGAVTLCSGTGGCSGPVTSANSLVGTQAGDKIGDLVDGDLVALSNGNYVVSSPAWDNGTAADAGAVTWCSGAGGCNGPVTDANSVVGAQAGDKVGSQGVQMLSNYGYVARSPYWDNGAVTQAGAVTWGNGGGGTITGLLTSQNSVLGETAGGGFSLNSTFDSIHSHLIVGRPADNKVTVVTLGYKVYLPLVVK